MQNPVRAKQRWCQLSNAIVAADGATCVTCACFDTCSTSAASFPGPCQVKSSCIQEWIRIRLGFPWSGRLCAERGALRHGASLGDRLEQGPSLGLHWSWAEQSWSWDHTSQTMMFAYNWSFSPSQLFQHRRRWFQKGRCTRCSGMKGSGSISAMICMR